MRISLTKTITKSVEDDDEMTPASVNTMTRPTRDTVEGKKTRLRCSF